MNVQLAPAGGTAVRISSWTLAAIAFALAVLVLLAGYWPTVASMVRVWSHDGTYQYAFLIFPISVWVAYTLRDRARAHPPVPSVWGLAAVVALVAIWYAGHALAVNLLQHFALVALFPALVLTCWGWRALWTLKFPLGYLVVFAVPWGDGLVGPLQDVTAHMAVRALDLTGTPVLLNGREIVTPSATWMVAQACSGVKFFIACVALGSLYAYLMYTRAWKRVVFVVLAAIVPIIANGLRVYFTILIGEAWGLHYATGTDHMIFGWQFFGTVLLLLLLFGWFFRDRISAPGHAVAQADKPVRMRAGIWLAALALLVAGPVLAAALVPAVTPQSLVLAAPGIAGWHASAATRDAWQPSFAGPAGEVRATYRSATYAMAIDVFHAVYTGRPRSGHSLISFGNNVFDPDRMHVLATADRPITLAGGAHVTARELRLTGAQGERLVWYWYCVDGRCTASPVVAKMLQAWQALRGAGARSAVWALSLPVAHSVDDQARTALRAFAQAMPAAGAWQSAAAARAPAGGAP